MPDEGGCSWYLCQGWNEEVKVCLIIKFKILGISDTFWFQTFVFFCIIIVFEVTHIWRQQKVTNTWPSHFHDLQKGTIDLMFKIMKSENTWQILRTPLPITHPHRFCLDIINVCFFSGFLKFGLSHVWMQMKFWILWKFSQVIFCQTIKETKQVYIFHYSSYFLNNFLLSLCQ